MPDVETLKFTRLICLHSCICQASTCEYETLLESICQVNTDLRQRIGIKRVTLKLAPQLFSVVAYVPKPVLLLLLLS